MSDSDTINRLGPDEMPVRAQSEDDGGLLEDEAGLLFVESEGDKRVFHNGNDDGADGGDDGVYGEQSAFLVKHHTASYWDGHQGRRTVPRTLVAAGVVCALLAGVGIGVSAARIRVLGTSVVQQSSGNVATDTGFTLVPNTIVVDVKGDVRHPGLVTAPSTARVQDVVALAGGFVHEEDGSAVNLAAPVDDGEEIVIPNAALSASSSSTSGMVNSDSSGSSLQAGTPAKVDLNTADAKTLETIPGIGPTKANAIVEYRQTHGLFHTVADLQNVKGIGPVTYSKIAPYVVILPYK